MKFLFAIAVLLSAQLTFSQDYDVDVVTNNNNYQTMGSWVVSNPNAKPEEIKGSPHLFDQNQVGIISVKGGKDLQINNMNYNGYTDRIVVIVSTDSIFSFDAASISKVVLGTRNFESIRDYKKSGSGFYEVVASSDGLKLLKKHHAEIREGAFNPMTQKQQTPDRYAMKSDYYIYQDGGDFKEIKVKRKTISKYFKNKKKEVENFAKENKLSFKKEEDLKKIFHFHQNITE